MNKNFLIQSNSKYCTHSINKMSLSEIYDLLTSEDFDVHFIVFNVDDYEQRFCLKQINNMNDLLDICKNNLNYCEYNINSGEYNILLASNIDSYWKNIPY